jgi:hypothetical protein
MATSKIANALEHVHTPDSWARAVFQGALKAHSDGKPLPGFAISEHTDCVQVCIDTPLGRFCICL